MADAGPEETPDADTGLLDQSEPEQFRCRYYENALPDVDDMVVVQVTSIGANGMVVRATTRRFREEWIGN
jgi:hypothetical protein